MKLALASVSILATSSLAGAASPQCDQVLESHLPPAAERFGARTAMDGRTMVALEFNASTAGSGPVWLHFHTWTDAGAWQRVQTESVQAWSPAKVVLDDSRGTLFLGDPTWPGASSGEGRVLMYERDPSTAAWSLAATIESPVPQASAGFGCNVVMQDERLFVSELGGALPSTGGRVHVWEPTAGFVDVISRPASLTGQNFGSGLAVAGDELFVGMPFRTAGVDRIGAALRYARDSVTGTWMLQQQIDPPAPEDLTLFGVEVLGQGDVLVIGEPLRNVAGQIGAGRLYVLRPDSTGDWQVTQEIEPPMPQVHSNLGYWLDMDDDRLVFLDAVPIGPNVSRHLAVYRDNGTDMILEQIIDPVLPAEWQYGNRALSIANGRIAVGGLHASNQQFGRGRVETFDIRDGNQDGVRDACQALGSSFCGPAAANTTGYPAWIAALDTGAPLTALDVVVNQLPPGSMGYTLVSQGTGFVAGPGGSAGNLCIVCIAHPAIGRYASQPQIAGEDGSASTLVNPTALPSPTGGVSVLAGETWNFQYWFRETGGATNFSDAAAVTF